MFVSAFLYSFPLQALTIDESTTSLSLDNEIHYYVDEQDQLHIQDMLTKSYPFQANHEGALNFGHTSASVWIKLPLHFAAAATHTKTWLIELGYPALTRADLHIVRHEGNIETLKSGYSIPASKQLYPHHHFVFPVALSPGETATLYLNIQRKGGAVQAPLRLWDRWALVHEEIRNNYLYGATFGIMYGLFFYNLFLLITIRLRYHFFYLAYLSFNILSMHAITGFGYLLLWPDHPELNGVTTVISCSMTIALAMQFLRAFVHVDRFSVLLDRALMTLMSIGVLIALLQMTVDAFFSAEAAAFALISSIIVPIIAFYCWRKGSRPAAFFLLGWASLLIGITSFSLSLFGLAPVNFFTKNGLLMGSTIEVILLSLGLADRFNTERKERYLALAEKHDALVKLKETESRLMYRALYSATTGLPNRNLLRECMSKLIENRDLGTRFSLLLVNFSNFHEFNKTLGHQNGDAILRLLADRLKKIVLQFESIHPISNSENNSLPIATVEGVTFGCILLNVDESTAREDALSLVKQLEQPFAFQGMSLQIDVFVGVSQYPAHGNSADHMMRSAQIALELAGNHPDKVTVYNPDEDPYSAQRLMLLSDLRKAIEQDKLELYLQPQLDLSGSKVTGAEVLIRWKHPQHGFIPPDKFIPLAERTGVIQSLTYWVFKKAFSQLQQLNQLGYNLTLSVNISARNLQDPTFQEKVLLAAREFHVPPSQIVMELTETAVMLNENSGTRILYQLDSAGFGIAIDDFGTGYSSLAYLKRLPVQEIKIDRTFIKDMAQQLDDQVIVTTTLQMGHNLGLRVVAEGIEDEITLNFLRKAGCDLAQGYFIAKLMPFNEFLVWLEQRMEMAPRHVAVK